MQDQIVKPEAVHLINQFVEERGIKKAWIASQVGVQRASFSRWMSGKWKPSLEARRKIEEVTNGVVPAAAWEIK